MAVFSAFWQEREGEKEREGLKVFCLVFYFEACLKKCQKCELNGINDQDKMPRMKREE